MGGKETKRRYRKPSDLENFILDMFLNRMYEDPHGVEKFSPWRIEFLYLEGSESLFVSVCIAVLFPD